MSLDQLGPREINRYALTGSWDCLFLALLKECCHCDGFGEGDLDEQFRAHVNRGGLMLHKQVRDLSDLVRLVPQS